MRTVTLCVQWKKLQSFVANWAHEIHELVFCCVTQQIQPTWLLEEISHLWNMGHFPQTAVLCSQQTTGMYTNHKIDWDGYWQQSDTQPILISAPQWPNRTYNAPTRLYRVGKKPSVKADLAIYSHAVYASGQCMSESLILGHNLDFSSCDILVGFCKSSRIYSWTVAWEVRLNSGKCKALNITNKWAPIQFDYTINGGAIRWKPFVRYLGIYVNSSLPWSYHCKMVASKASKLLAKCFVQDYVWLHNPG